MYVYRIRKRQNSSFFSICYLYRHIDDYLSGIDDSFKLMYDFYSRVNIHFFALIIFNYIWYLSWKLIFLSWLCFHDNDEWLLLSTPFFFFFFFPFDYIWWETCIRSYLLSFSLCSIFNKKKESIFIGIT